MGFLWCGFHINHHLGGALERSIVPSIVLPNNTKEGFVMEDKLENLQALIEGSGLGDVRQKVRGMSEARVLWVLDGYKVDGLPSGREFFIEWDSLEHVQNQSAQNRERQDNGTS